ncbi:putative manganese transporter [Nocardioides campestrisoli]|uniref:putative manganese transporter n=1 Tax=Nocardioides campestrisoli TaxID=2736757 RepID=UPI0015E74184|nr:putative manganese transporter [Nocardioides campestrisoli]
MIELVIRPMADAFMQVGVFVALLAVPFGWARYRWGPRFDAALERHRGWGPVVAALLTVPPGCGGAIVVMAVYARGAVSYGAAVAALVATTGDAAWVLLAADPVLTLQLKVLLVVTGVTTGYLVDLLGIDPAQGLRPVPGSGSAAPRSGTSPVPAAPAGVALREAVPGTVRAQAGGPVPAPGAGSPVAALGVRAWQELGVLPGALWLLLGAGLLVSMPVTFQLLDPAAVGDELLGGADPYLALGAVGTALCLVGFLRDGCQVADDDPDTASPSSMAQVLRQGGREVAFVTMWVTVAYVAWALLSATTGFDGSQLPLFGVAGVLVGALVGLVPGCALQIVFAGIFLSGGMPLSTLVANSISQDGDALIPLLALRRRSALLAAVITTLPALVVGGALLLLD